MFFAMRWGLNPQIAKTQWFGKIGGIDFRKHFVKFSFNAVPLICKACLNSAKRYSGYWKTCEEKGDIKQRDRSAPLTYLLGKCVQDSGCIAEV